MGILLTATAICALVWLSIAALRGWISFQWMACPTLVAALVIFLGSVFGRDFYSLDVGKLPISMDRVLWVWMVGQFVVLFLMQRIRPLAVNTLDVLVAGLLILIVVSTFAYDYTFRDNLPLSRMLFFNVMPIGIYFVARHSPISERQLGWLLYGLTAFAGYLAFTAVAEWQDWPAVVFPAYIMDERFFEFLGRAHGPFLNPVACGIFQVVGCVAALGVWSTSGKHGRLVIGALLPLIVVGVYATFTRSVWLSLALGVGLAVWLSASSRRRGAFLIISATGTAVFLAVFADDIYSFKRDRNVSETEMAESVQLRPLLAQVALNMFVDRPIFGHGFGQYSHAKRLYHQQVSDAPLKKAMPYMQHNVVLSYMTELGAMGTALLLGILALFAASSWRLFRRSADRSANRWIGLLGLVMLSTYVVNGMFHDVSIVPMAGSLFYFILGLVNHLDSTVPRATSSALWVEQPTPDARVRQRLAS